MRPEKMAFWNVLVPSVTEAIEPTTSSHIPMTNEHTDGSYFYVKLNSRIVISPCQVLRSKIESKG